MSEQAHIESGVVVKKALDKAVTVRIARREKHPMYKKYISRHKKLLVHDENNQCAVGDVVTIASCRPISKNKSWRLVSIVRSEGTVS